MDRLIILKKALHLVSNLSHLSHFGNLRSKNPKNIIFSYIKYKHNSIRNKFENLLDILSIEEAKLDSSFPNAQFLLSGFHESLRLDINNRTGGLFVYIKASVPSNILTKFKLPINIQIIFFEINLRKERWLSVSIYKSPLQRNQYFLDELGELMDFNSHKNMTVNVYLEIII